MKRKKKNLYNWNRKKKEIIYNDIFFLMKKCYLCSGQVKCPRKWPANKTSKV